MNIDVILFFLFLLDTCNLPVAPGDCRGAFQKFYYDSVSRICREFTYGGCEGNANRFSTMVECESICIHHEEPVQPGNDTSLSSLCKYSQYSSSTCNF